MAATQASTRLKQQNNALSVLPERPCGQAVSTARRHLGAQNTNDSQTASTSFPSQQKGRHELEAPRKRIEVCHTGGAENVEWDEANPLTETQSERLRYWIEQGVWPSESEERRMKSFRENYILGAMARRRSSPLGHVRSSNSLTAGTDSSKDQEPLSEKKSYKDGSVAIHLKDFGSFTRDHKEGITTESRRLCQKLLNTAQKLPEGTLFSDELFPHICEMVRGKKEATVVCYIRPELVPSPKIRAARGAKHLDILNETIDESWINAQRCCGRRPQPDYSIGIDREAFSPEQMRKLQPFIGTQLDEESQLTATYDMCFPFLTTEVKCGSTGLDVADLQNAVSQTFGLRGLVTLFRLVHREQELHRKVLGFSISHDNEAVRIYGHYPFIDGEKTEYYRCKISMFDISPTIEGDQRWKTLTFVQNVQDLWAAEHFQMICSAVDMLQVEAASSQQSAPPSQVQCFTQGSARSGLSQQLETLGPADETQEDGSLVTPGASTVTAAREKKRKRSNEEG